VDAGANRARASTTVNGARPRAFASRRT